MSAQRIWFSRLDSQFRITIPDYIIEELGWKPGMKLQQRLREGGIYLEPATDETIEKLNAR